MAAASAKPKSAPPPERGIAQIRPPMAPTISLATYSPMPLPV
jgi:hypothetical protein